MVLQVSIAIASLNLFSGVHVHVFTVMYVHMHACKAPLHDIFTNGCHACLDLWDHLVCHLENSMSSYADRGYRVYWGCCEACKSTGVLYQMLGCITRSYASPKYYPPWLSLFWRLCYAGVSSLSYSSDSLWRVSNITSWLNLIIYWVAFWMPPYFSTGVKLSPAIAEFKKQDPRDLLIAKVPLQSTNLDQ